jgi:hypothetical protein
MRPDSSSDEFTSPHAYTWLRTQSKYPTETKFILAEAGRVVLELQKYAKSLRLLWGTNEDFGLIH